MLGLSKQKIKKVTPQKRTQGLQSESPLELCVQSHFSVAYVRPVEEQVYALSLHLMGLVQWEF